MAIEYDFEKMWSVMPQYFNVRKQLNVPDWINETCCVQLSHAMNVVGWPVLPEEKRTWKSANGLKHFLSVIEVRDYFIYRHGGPDVDSRTAGIDRDVKKFKEAIQGRQGVIIFGERHVDLWNGTKIHGERYNENALWFAKSAPKLGILLWEVGTGTSMEF